MPSVGGGRSLDDPARGSERSHPCVARERLPRRARDTPLGAHTLLPGQYRRREIARVGRKRGDLELSLACALRRLSVTGRLDGGLQTQKSNFAN